MNTSILPQAMGKIVGQTELFNLGMATGLRAGEPVKPCLLILRRILLEEGS